MAHFFNFLGLINKIESPDLEVIQDRCVVVRNRNVTCGKCVDSCTSGCLSFEDGELVVSPEKCISCGTCASVCPSSAIVTKKPTDAQLLDTARAATAAADGLAVFCCQELLDSAKGLYDPAKVTPVKCLGRVDEYQMLALLSEGATKVVCVQGGCATCAHKAGSTAVAKAAANVRQIAAAWNIPGEVTITTKLPGALRADADAPAADHDTERRGFFAAMRDNAKDLATATGQTALESALGDEDEAPAGPTKVDENGLLPQAMPERRELLLSILDAAGTPSEEPITTTLWAQLSIDADKCSSCRMCATFCPTGAIFKFHTKKGAIGIKQRLRQCTGCGSCADVCAKDAITLNYTVKPADVVSGDVTRWEMAPCSYSPADEDYLLNTMRTRLGMERMWIR